MFDRSVFRNNPFTLQGNSASAGSSKGTLHMQRPASDPYQVNDHKSVQNLWPIQNRQKEASKLLMWSNGGPIRNTPNNRLAKVKISLNPYTTRVLQTFAGSERHNSGNGALDSQPIAGTSAKRRDNTNH